ncbi:hypothetical protein APHAL10511_008716 [Amanita phalloides]|nr:hypothetical protein APHAL10511_008716 [Amanita phalloides]
MNIIRTELLLEQSGLSVAPPECIRSASAPFLTSKPHQSTSRHQRSDVIDSDLEEDGEEDGEKGSEEDGEEDSEEDSEESCEKKSEDKEADEKEGEGGDLSNKKQGKGNKEKAGKEESIVEESSKGGQDESIVKESSKEGQNQGSGQDNRIIESSSKGITTEKNFFGQNEGKLELFPMQHLFFIVQVDVQIETSSELQGASCTIGGHFRGRALGNIFNAGDAKDVMEGDTTMIGKVKIFRAGEDPSTTKPQMTMKVKVGSNLAPVLGQLAKRYSPVKKNNNRVFIYEEGNWSVKGHFDAAVEDDDSIVWERESGEYSLLVALDEDKSIDKPKTFEGKSFGTSLTQSAPKWKGKTSDALAAKKLDADYRDQLIHILNIPADLLRVSDRVEGGLQLYYKKYQTCIQALSTAESMTSAGEWAIRRPSDTEIVELFIGKTMWHSHLKKIFPKVPKYPEMQKWLNEEEDALPTIDIWGEEKNSFSFKDLVVWMEEEDNKVKRKGKGKAKAEHKRGRKGKKGKEVILSLNSSSGSESGFLVLVPRILWKKQVRTKYHTRSKGKM